MNGFLFVDKPTGMTSFDVVRQVKRVFKTKKVGHAGTLDPDASGLLLIAVNHATRLLRFLELEPKTYTFEIVLGEQTNTDDAVGEVIKTLPFDVEAAAISDLIPSFSGKIKQRPPLFSAIHIDGKRAYKKARDGEEFEIPEREVEVFELNFLNLKSGVIEMEASVSSGTYIRSIARDFGIALGTVAHARKIRRTRLARYGVENANPMEDIEAGSLISAFDVLSESIETRSVDAKDLGRLRNGLQINISSTDDAIGSFVGIVHENELIGVSEVIDQQHFDAAHGSRIQPRVIFPE